MVLVTSWRFLSWLHLGYWSGWVRSCPGSKILTRFHLWYPVLSTMTTFTHTSCGCLWRRYVPNAHRERVHILIELIQKANRLYDHVVCSVHVKFHLRSRVAVSEAELGFALRHIVQPLHQPWKVKTESWKRQQKLQVNYGSEFAWWRILPLSCTHSKLQPKAAFAAAGPGLWNSLLPHLTDANLPYSWFRRSLKTFLPG